ncbi:hypothetical protein CDL15_Pgr027804 [Punica granatum]|uniref:MI domain-containing protein n=1 Tax=Punica granatum TaxID=22663 RepID=A0A218XJ98_PUNGR|nr:hypothetical protein CDL15_Pgr027804 [Punica granatum]
MESSDGSNENTQPIQLPLQSADPFSITPLKISLSRKSPKSPISPKSPRSPRSSKSPMSPESPRVQGKHKGSPLKNDRRSHSPRDGRPKKGGAGGKGTWGGLLDVDDNSTLDPDDPNYDSSKELNEDSNIKQESFDFALYKKKATTLIQEYFSTGDVSSAADELRELAMPNYSYYFVKKLVSMAMDRPDNEKEMAAVLLSALYSDIIEPQQLYKGFRKLLESADDLIVDTPDTVDVLSLFVARAVVDDILPPSFLTKQMAYLPKDSKGFEVLKKAEKGYLGTPHHAEVIERRWASKNKSVENVKDKINNLLEEYITSGDRAEAFRCMKDLKVPFFHHEIVKRVLVMAIEKLQTEDLLFDLLKEVYEEGLINASQVSKGFERMIDSIEDLTLDVPNARGKLQHLIAKAASEGWLCASSLKSLSVGPKSQSLDESVARAFKAKAHSIIQEYFLSGDISEVISCLETDKSTYSSQLNAIFIKKLITLAMDRKNREKEMASVLLSSLCFPAEDIVSGFSMLIEAAEDTALDNPVVVEDLALFLARAVVDEALAPQHLDEVETRFMGSDPIGTKVLQMARSLLKARLSGERILRCWGGWGNNSPRWAVEDVKDKITRLLEEYESGGGAREARRCIKELGMPFFHHEVVKKALIIVIEKRSERMWVLLRECLESCLITPNQMIKGFGRVGECIDDLALDVPDAEKQFLNCIERAKAAGWLDSSFSYRKSAGMNDASEDATQT